MRGFLSGRHGLIVLGVVALVALTIGVSDASGKGSVLKDPRPVKGAASLADIGVNQLERLPWDNYIVRFNMARSRPVSIAACYLMDKHLVVVSAAGRVYCLDRRNLEPRWVGSLKHRLARAPADGPGDYVFLTKDAGGAYWVETFNKRSGAQGERFPRRLKFAAASGIDANQSMAFIPSLGGANDRTTLSAVSLVTGRRTWGYHGSSLVFGGAHVDPSGSLVVFAGQDGKVTSLRASATAPTEENWITPLSGHVDSAPVVTPEHVIVGTHDGLLYNLNVLSGQVNWMKGLDAPVRKRGSWVLGSTQSVAKSTGVEGAKDVNVDQYVGSVFTRTMRGLHAHDLVTGRELFLDGDGGRPLCQQGKWLVTRGANGYAKLRDASDGYKVKAKLNLGMFALIPTNRAGGAIYACTSDGAIVAALPK